MKILYYPDTPTGGAGGAPGAPPAPAEPTDVAAASRQYIASLKPEQLSRELELPAEMTTGSEGEEDPGALNFEAPGDTSTATDGEPPAADEPAEEPAAPITREDGATWNTEAERWQRDGKFVEGAAPEGWVKPDAPAATVVALPGFAERGEEALEIETTDPAVAERLQRLAKDGLRRNDYLARSAKLDERQAELEAVEQAFDLDPVGFILDQVKPELQADVARALLLEHFDKLLPDLEKWYEDAGARNAERVALRDRMKETSAQARDQSARLAYSRQLLAVAHSLVPETTDDATVRLFMADVENDLVNAARRGVRLTPDTVPQLIANRIRLYGFATQAGSAAPAAPAPAAPRSSAAAAPPATARPVSDRARAVAARAGSPSTAEARAAQDRVKRAQANRRAAAAVPPAGAGAATVSAPVIPADADVRTASKLIRQRGGGWTG